jgi:histone deacetylase HOS3
MTLRDRKKPSSGSSTPEVARKPGKGTHTHAVSSGSSASVSASDSETVSPPRVAAKKLPRVVLHVRPPTDAPQ